MTEAAGSPKSYQLLVCELLIMDDCCRETLSIVTLTNGREPKVSLSENRRRFRDGLPSELFLWSRLAHTVGSAFPSEVSEVTTPISAVASRPHTGTWQHTLVTPASECVHVEIKELGSFRNCQHLIVR